MAQERDWLQQRCAEIRKAMIEADRLPALVALVDYFVRENLFRSALSAIEDVAGRVREGRRETAPDGDGGGGALLLHVALQYAVETGALEGFEPECSAVTASITEVLDQVASFSVRARRLANSSKLSIFLSSAAEGTSYSSLSGSPSRALVIARQAGEREPRGPCGTDGRFLSMRASVIRDIDTSFRDAFTFAGKFKEVGRVLSFLCHEWPLMHAEWQQMEDKLLHSHFRDVLARLTEARGHIDQLHPKPLGVIYVNSYVLRDRLEPLLKQCTRDVRQMVRDALERRGKSLVRALKSATAEMERRPAKLGPFVEFAGRLEAAAHRQAEFSVMQEECEHLHDLLEEQSVQVAREKDPSGFTVRPEDLLWWRRGDERAEKGPGVQAADAFHTAIATATMYFQDRLKPMAQELSQQISALGDEVLALQSLLDDQQYISVSPDPGGVLESLDNLGRQIRKCEDRASDLHQHQKTLGTTEADLGRITEARAVWNQRREVWATLAAWLEQRHAWGSSQVGVVQLTIRRETPGAQVGWHFHPDRPLRVTAVDPGSPAAVAGLRLNSRVLKIREGEGGGWRLVKTPEELDAAVEAAGSEFTVGVAELDPLALHDGVTSFHQTARRLHQQQRTEITAYLLGLVSDERKVLPMICHLCNPDMQAEHWRPLFDATGRSYNPDIFYRLEGLRGYGMLKFETLVVQQSEMATGQSEIQQGIDRIQETWRQLRLEVKEHRQGCLVLHRAGDTEEVLRDGIGAFEQMLSSRFVANLQHSVQRLLDKFRRAKECLELWVRVQTGWIKLEGVFRGEDMRKTLPEEAKRFEDIGHSFQNTMKAVQKGGELEAFLLDTATRDSMHEAAEQLQEAEARLDEYLELKRRAFPRLYCLSQPQLIRLFADTRDARAVARVVPLLWSAVGGLVWDVAEQSGEADQTTMPLHLAPRGVAPTHLQVIGLDSAEGERLSFPVKLAARGGPEVWLARLEGVIRKAVNRAVDAARLAYLTGQNRAEWLAGVGMPPGITHHSVQAIHVVDHFMFTLSVESALRKGDLSACLEAHVSVLDRTIAVAALPKLDALQRAAITAAIVAGVSGRDTVQELIAVCAVGTADWAWQRRLRYYFDTAGEGRQITAEIAGVRLPYGYEYLGARARSVQTSLLQRTTLLFASALSHAMTPAAVGPAQAGKTTAVRDCADALARQLVIVPCTEGMTLLALGRALNGAMQGGAWICCEGCEQMTQGVCSVLASLIRQVSDAQRSGVRTVQVDGKDITLHADFNILLTARLSPARPAPLPEALRVSLRPVAVMQPPLREIAEVQLLAAGYSMAAQLAVSLELLWRHAPLVLAADRPVRWGAAELVAALRLAAERREQTAQLRPLQRPPEAATLLGAVRDAVTPAMQADDVDRFDCLTRDIMPAAAAALVGTEEEGPLMPPRPASLTSPLGREHSSIPAFEAQLSESIVSSGTAEQTGAQLSALHVLLSGTPLGVHTALLQQCSQLRTALQMRPAACLLGSPCSGKSACLRSAAAMAGAHAPRALYASALSPPELYGWWNSATQEWETGAFARALRSAADPQRTKEQHWVVLDGVMDDAWTAGLDTVLAAPHTAYLPSGEHIPLAPRCRVLIETDSLAGAAPSAVARCAVVYCAADQLPWRVVFLGAETRLKAKHAGSQLWDDDVVAHLQAWLPSAFAALPAESGPLGNSLSRVRLVQSMMAMLDGVLTVGAHDAVVDEPCGMALRKRDEAAAGGGAEDGAPDSPRQTQSQPASPSESRAPAGGIFAVSGALSGSAPLDPAQQYLRMLLVFAVAWGLGGSFGQRGRELLERPLVALSDILDPTGTVPRPGRSMSHFEVYPSRAQMQWIPWEQRISRTVQLALSTCVTDEHFVPTPARYALMMVARRYALAGHSAIILGPAASGKTCLLRTLERLYCDDGSAGAAHHPQAVRLALTHLSTAGPQRERIAQRLVRLRKGVLCGAGRRGVTVVADDCGISDSAAPSELLRELATEGSFACISPGDGGALVVSEVTQVSVLMAATVPALRRAPPERLAARAATLLCDAPDRDTLCDVMAALCTAYVEQHHWTADAVSAIAPGTRAACEALHRLRKELPATDENPLACFSARDLARAAQGLGLGAPHIASREAALRLLAHELLRTMSDRLLDVEDQNWLREQLADVFTQHCGGWPSGVELEAFGSTVSAAGASVLRAYESVGHVEEAGPALYEAVTQQSSCPCLPQLPAFNEPATRLALGVARVLRMPGGSVLFVGMPGSGRKSIAAIASVLEGADHLVPPRSGASRDDLHEAAMTAVCDNKHVCLTVDDACLRCGDGEAFLCDLLLLLEHGELDGLLGPEDSGRLTAALARRPGSDPTPRGLQRTFRRLCRSNLHCVLCLPPGPALARRTRLLPSLTASLTVIGYAPWTRDALEVAARGARISGVDEDPELADIFAAALAFAHEVAQEAAAAAMTQGKGVHVTTATFFHCLQVADSLLEERYLSTSAKLDCLGGALETISTSHQQLCVWQEEQFRCEQIVEEAQEAAAAIAAELEQQGGDTDGTRGALFEMQQEVAAAEAAHAKAVEECARTVDPAQGIYTGALEALQALGKRDLEEVAAWRAPPGKASLVTDAVAACFGIKPGWENTKKTFADPQLVERLSAVDPEGLSDRIVSRLKGIMRDPDFMPDYFKAISRACGAFCQWVRALEHYALILRDTTAVREARAEAATKLREAQERLAQRQSASDEFDQQVLDLQQQHQEQTAMQKEAAEEGVEIKRRLEIVTLLVKDLHETHVRWTQEKDETVSKLKCMAGDCLLGAAATAYTGPFSSDTRSHMLARIQGYLAREGPECRSDWGLSELQPPQLSGRPAAAAALPQDDLGSWAGHITSRSSLFCVCIDPYGIARRWLRGSMQPDELRVLHSGAAGMLEGLQQAVRSGCATLVDGVDPANISPELRTLLTLSGGSAATVNLGSVEMGVSSLFRLWLCSPGGWPDAEATADVQSVACFVDFSDGSDAGIEHIALHHIAAAADPRAAQEAGSTFVYSAALQDRVLQTHSALLQAMSEYDGSVIEDEAVVEQMKQMRESADAARSAADDAKKAAEAADAALEYLRPLARRLCAVHRGASRAARACSRARASLDFVLHAFVNGCGSFPSPPCSAPAEGAEAAAEGTGGGAADAGAAVQGGDGSDEEAGPCGGTVAIVRGLCKGLPLAQRTVLRGCVAAAAAAAAGALSEQERLLLFEGAKAKRVSIFGGGGSVADIRQMTDGPSWVTAAGWSQLALAAKRLAVLAPVLAEITHAERGKDWAEWQQRCVSACAADREMPSGAASQLTDWQRCILVRSLCEAALPDFLEVAAEPLVGPPEPPGVDVCALDLLGAAETASNKVPIAVLSADAAGVAATFHEAAITAGRTAVCIQLAVPGAADAALQKAQWEGQWLLVCHGADASPAAARWAAGLEARLGVEAAATFRIFVAAPPECLPLRLLQGAVRVAPLPPGALHARCVELLGTAADDEDSPPGWGSAAAAICASHAWLTLRAALAPLLGCCAAWPPDVGPAATAGALLAWRQLAGATAGTAPPADGAAAAFSQNPDVAQALQELMIVHLLGPHAVGPEEAFTARCAILETLETDSFGGGGLWGEPAAPAEPLTVLDAVAELRFPSRHTAAAPLPPAVAAELLCAEGATLVADLAAAHGARPPPAPVPQEAAGPGRDLAPQMVDNTLEEILDSLPEPTGTGGASLDAFTTLRQEGDPDAEHPMAAVLAREIEVHNRVTALAADDISRLRRALRGQLPMSEDLSDAAGALLRRRAVPRRWLREGYAAAGHSLDAWLEGHRKRVRFFDEWHRIGPPPAFWLPCFVFPEALLAALALVHCRCSEQALADVTLATAVTLYQSADMVLCGPERGIFVYGVALRRAAWGNGALTAPEQLCPYHPSAQLPLLHVWVVDSASGGRSNTAQLGETYRCPVYHRYPPGGGEGYGKRFWAIDLPCEGPAKQWALCHALAVVEVDGDP
eukprot:TRINITY_DN3081_c1_g2_i2.p1 TRINITY_DN3081_c1_g2~~TRINITY_DN3081_c1_g2_i2.p1  ORF type:complete len:4570 (+),score=1076.91 TRINITY_DN3081_c1_g2_i2:1761-13712(+)